MAKTIIKNFTISVGGTDYAAVAKGRELNISVDEIDVTNGDSGNNKEFIGGLLSYELTVSLIKDSDLSGLDAAMYAAIGTSVAWSSKLTDGSTSASNPLYSGNAIVMGWSPFSGAVGDAFAGDLKLRGTGAITRATS